MMVDATCPLHLTYCLNVHPGESFADQWRAIRDHASAVRSGINAGDHTFGLGLRLGAAAIDELKNPALVQSFKSWCDENGYYVFTINGFPYGTFHNAPVKAEVYRPDWTCEERLSYTCAIADVLAQWLPDGVKGSISTVPLWYAPDYPDDPSRENAQASAVRQLLLCAEHLEQLAEQTGRDIALALEPEPWCALESSRDVLSFYETLDLPDDQAALFRRRVGVCVDTCHCALAFEQPSDVIRQLTQAGIRIPKIQLSAALSVDASHEGAREALSPFAEPVYFHQAAQQNPSGLKRWPDLPPALDALTGEGELRVHYHVPLQWKGDGVLCSTRENMDASFWKLIQSGVCEHLEIETYTFHILPRHVAGCSLAESIREEYTWVLQKLGISNS